MKITENSSQESGESLKQLSNDESRTENNTINHHSVWRAFCIRYAFIFGVFVGICIILCIILIKPWNYMALRAYLWVKSVAEMPVKPLHC